MIEEVHANLFDVRANAIVNPVNCVGVMGRGIALEVKQRYPRSYRAYKVACECGHLRPGVLFYVAGHGGERNVINFASKDHWRQPSKLVWIEMGMEHLRRHYGSWGLTSIAMPQLGCGLGKLSWEDVRPLIWATFESEPVRVIVSLSTADMYEGQEHVQPSLFDDVRQP